MTLQELVGRLGLAVVARRAGVSVATLKRWLSHGPSAKGAATLATITRRHLAAVKAAASRREGDRFRDSLDEPEESELEPEQVLPKKPPGKSREVQASKRAEGVRAGRRVIDSEFNIGETQWVTIGQSVLEVNISTLVRGAWDLYEESGRDYVSVKFLFFRFIPFNPSYAARGLAELVSKQGTWVEQWVTTGAVSYKPALARYIEHFMEKASLWAQTRIIFLEMIAVNTFNRKKEMPKKKDILEKPLKAT